MADLEARGQAFYDTLTAALTKHHEAMKPLILEAARAVDRLHAIDDVVTGRGVLELLRFRLRDDEGRVAEVKFDAVLAEARQQQAILATLLKVITPNLNESAGVAQERDLLDEIAKRRSARRAGTAKTPSRAKRSG